MVPVLRPELNAFTVSSIVLNGSCVTWREKLAFRSDSDVTSWNNPFKLIINLLQCSLVHCLSLMVEDEDIGTRTIEAKSRAKDASACKSIQIASRPNRKDRTNGKVGVYYWRSVQGIESNCVLSCFIQDCHVRSFFREPRVNNSSVLQCFKDQGVCLHILIELHVTKVVSGLYFVGSAVSQVLCDLFTCFQDSLVNFAELPSKLKFLELFGFHDV